MNARTSLALYLMLTLSGCSIAMAMSGNPEPNFDAFDVGSTRKQVEIQLGTPASSRPLENGNREDIYRYQMGNSPNGARAWMNFYIDLGTIFLWEVPGTIIEAMQGREEESQIVYGADDRVIEVKGYRPPPPSVELKAAREAQQQYKMRPAEEPPAPQPLQK
jgi:hypothetical protein